MSTGMDDAEDLLLMFQKMGTTDPETLLKQFQTIIPGVDAEVAKFFLEANSWTLQNAIFSFFENNGEDVKKQIAVLNKQKPQMSFVLQDPGKEQYTSGDRFRKVWYITNTGPTQWPTGCSLNHVGGETFGAATTIKAPPLMPNEGCNLCLDLIAPQNPGEYHGSWMLCTPGENGIYFGENLWVIISVLPSNTSTATGTTSSLLQPQFQPFIGQPQPMGPSFQFLPPQLPNLQIPQQANTPQFQFQFPFPPLNEQIQPQFPFFQQQQQFPFFQPQQQQQQPPSTSSPNNMQQQNSFSFGGSSPPGMNSF